MQDHSAGDSEALQSPIPTPWDLGPHYYLSKTTRRCTRQTDVDIRSLVWSAYQNYASLRQGLYGEV